MVRAAASPMESVGKALVRDGEDADAENVFAAIDEMRIPVEYLARCSRPAMSSRSAIHFSGWSRCGGTCVISTSATRSGLEIATEAGMEPHELEAMYRMVAIADYDDRYVIPEASRRGFRDAFIDQDPAGSISPTGTGPLAWRDGGVGAPDPFTGVGCRAGTVKSRNRRLPRTARTEVRRARPADQAWRPARFGRSGKRQRLSRFIR